MIQISKNEAEYMRKIGYGDLVKQSHSNVRTMYLVEDIKAMKRLNGYRESLKQSKVG